MACSVCSEVYSTIVNLQLLLVSVCSVMLQIKCSSLTQIKVSASSPQLPSIQISLICSHIKVT